MEISTDFTEKANRDYEWIQQALYEGDQRAYAKLMDNYRESLFYLMLKMTKDVDDAEDMVMEAFSKAFKNLHQYTPTYAFSTWLFKIAANNCIDFMRKKKKYTLSLDSSNINESDFEDLLWGMPNNCPDPEQVLMKKQSNQLLREIVDQLKPRYKRLVRMRYFQEMSYEEISSELHMPLGTVKAQLFRARALLAGILSQGNQNS